MNVLTTWLFFSPFSGLFEFLPGSELSQFCPYRFMPSFLRLGSWNVVMFVTYEQLKRAIMAARQNYTTPL